jgi:hypothetical protein
LILSKKLKNIIILLSLILSCTALADDGGWEIPLDWLQTSLPEISPLEFKQSQSNFNCCGQRDYQLRLNQRVNENWHIETAIGYKKGELTLGAHKQKVSMGEWSVIPRYQINSLLNIGFGVVHQMAGQFAIANGANRLLPGSTQWLLSLRTPGLLKGHYLDVVFFSQQWQRINITGNWLRRGQGDKRMYIRYSVNF